jgi:hypothetical protein
MDCPHYAHLFASHQELWDLSCWGDFRLRPSNLVAVEQARAGALRIVKGIEGGWDVALGSAAASEGCHHDPILEMQRSDLDRGEEIWTYVCL